MFSAHIAAKTRRLTVRLALLAIIGVAAWLRLSGLTWDDGHHLHPDERFLAIVGDRIRLPSDVAGYFDTQTSPLNPYNQNFDGFAYGTAPLFLTRALAEPLGFAGYDRIPLLGRALSALFDLGTVVLTFMLGRLVYGTAVGLVAAALLAVCVLHIQLAHFFAVDTFLTFFTTLAVYAAYRVWLHGGAHSGLLLGFAVGAAASTKLSAALLLPLIGLVALVPPPTRRQTTRRGARLVPLGLGGLAAIFTYRIGEPYSFAGTSFFDPRPNLHRFADLDRWVKISSGEIEVPFMIQWAGTANPSFALSSLLSWGFGPAAGLAALGGLVLATLELRRWPLHGHGLLLVAWAGLNLGYFSFQFAKFMRYFLPAYPVLAVLAACLLVKLSGPLARAAHNGFLRVLCRSALPAVLATTVLYALMFSSIYSRPNTRVEASEWLYRNVPTNAVLATEHWDDALPLTLAGPRPRFTQTSLDLYDEESPAKAQKLAEALVRSDYVILASNRLYGSIPRLPNRYPIAVEYYRLLFSGELGFEQAARFESRPSLLGLTVDDSGAQEDVTVYDHPTVQVFRKTSSFSAQYVADQLSSVPLTSIERVKPVDVGKRRGLLLAPDERARVQAGGTWADSFALDGLATHLAIPIWLVVVEALSLATLPLGWWLFRGSPDRGFAISKLLGLLLVSYLTWVGASLQIVPFGKESALASLAVLAASGAAVALRHRSSLVRDLVARRGLLLITETVFLGAFALMLLIRSLNPDLWHPTFGGEKPMDFAYLNAVVRSITFPPYDPWFAGGYINYYYFGFVSVAVLVHLTSVPPTHAYNLAIPTIFAMTATLSFSFGFAVVARCVDPAERRTSRLPVAAGVASAMTLCLAGNVDGVIQLREGLARLGGDGVQSSLPMISGVYQAGAGLAALVHGGRLPPFDFWRSTRFIGPEEPGPIHEFPYFTFLYGDLHAHMLALPLQVAAVIVGLELVRHGRALRPVVRRRGTRPRLPTTLLGDRRARCLIGLSALLLGTLRATNTWDFPTYLCIFAVACAIVRRSDHRFGWMSAPVAGAAGAAVLYAMSSLLFLPFIRHYELFYSGVDTVAAATDAGQFLVIHALFGCIMGGWIASELARTRQPDGAPTVPVARNPNYYGLTIPVVAGRRTTSNTAVTAVALAGLWALTINGRAVVGILLAGGLAVVTLAIARRRSAETLYLLALCGAALAALLLPEIIAVRGDVGRMNTVFKFYLQAWVLLALLAGPAFVLTLRRVTGQRRWGGWTFAWVVTAALLAIAAAIYPLQATPAKLGLRFGALPPTLDGMAYMAQAEHAANGRDLALPADHAAIRWLLQHVDGTPVILEGRAPLYQWGSRISIYTGLPTVLGWDWHQRQQRWGYQADIDARQRDVEAAYASRDWNAARSILTKYDVSYVVVGGVERAYYPAAGLEKFESAVGSDLEIVYRAGGVTIYRVDLS